MILKSVGIERAGKTTMLFRMALPVEVGMEIPVIGFNVETVKFKNVSIVQWDVGGGDKIRGLWPKYWAGAKAIIFTVNCDDRERIEEAAVELEKLCTKEALAAIPLLVLANEQQNPCAQMSVAEVTDKLGLHALQGRAWHIQACCMLTGQGLCEGVAWLATALKDARGAQ